MCMISCSERNLINQTHSSHNKLPAYYYGDSIMFAELNDDIYNAVINQIGDSSFIYLFGECFENDYGSTIDWENCNCLSFLHDTYIWQELNSIAHNFFSTDIETYNAETADVFWDLIIEILDQGYVSVGQIYTWVEEYELNEYETILLLYYNATCKYTDEIHKKAYVIINDGSERQLEIFSLSEYPDFPYIDSCTIFEYYIEESLSDIVFESIPSIILSGTYIHCDTITYETKQMLLNSIMLSHASGILTAEAYADCLAAYMSACNAERQLHSQELENISNHARSSTDTETIRRCKEALLIEIARHAQAMEVIEEQFRACCGH